MNVAAGAVLGFGGVVIAYTLHETTHVGVAHLFGGRVVDLGVSKGVLAIEIEYPDEDPPPERALRIVALAPLLIGVVLAATAVLTGVWDWIGQLGPYYTQYVAALLWLVFALPSPSDLRATIRRG